MLRPYRGVSPRIHPTAFIDASAQVIGDVEIGDESGTHPTTIGDDVTIGHGAIVHGRTIEHQCLIGMGAILLNGSHVGVGSIVAAGSVVVEEMKIPPGLLVMGSPARVRRQLRPTEIAEIRISADRYVWHRLDYMV